MQAKTYNTMDFLEICFLSAKDVRITAVNRDVESGKVVFSFINSNGECESLIADLNIGNDAVSASRLLESVKRIRKLIHTT